MADKYALIENGTVINIILWDGDLEAYDPGMEAVLDDGTATVGSTYSDGIFVPPVIVVPVPASVTPLQMRKALREMGLAATVKSFVASQSEDVQEAWEYANSIDRDNTLIATAAAALGMTDEQADDLFRLAASL
jgi:hypothetical protein